MSKLTDLIIEHEGCFPWMYLDTKGIVTCGVGTALRTVEDALKLPWDRDEETVRADYARVQSAAPGSGATAYATLSASRLTESVCMDLLQARLDADLLALRRYFPGFDTYPESARLALQDMAYNCGPAFALKFPELRRAVVLGRWDEAAAECHRRDVGAERNADTAALFIQAGTGPALEAA